jgi:caffeoyl-CoA O-methyltransferase
MSYEITITDEAIENYCRGHSSPPTSTQKELITATQEKIPNVAHMQVGHLEGKFLSLVASLMNAKSVLEFGTFTGYSALALAEGLPEDGKVVTLDRDPNATAIAKEFWEKSPQGKKIELILGDAQQTVQTLISEVSTQKRPQFDLAFIDADKAGYPTYYEAALKLVRKGGAILVDNVLWSGRILHPSDKSDHIIHDFNTMIKNDARVEKVMLPIRDGIFLLQIRHQPTFG